MITVINYGLGNINAIKRVYNNLNIPVKIATKVNDLENSEKYILPGVGAYNYAMEKLNKSGFNSIYDVTIKKPITTGRNFNGPSITCITASSISVFVFFTILCNLPIINRAKKLLKT